MSWKQSVCECLICDPQTSAQEELVNIFYRLCRKMKVGTYVSVSYKFYFKDTNICTIDGFQKLVI